MIPDRCCIGSANGRLISSPWTAEAGTALSVVEVVAEELEPSHRWATATTTKTRSSEHLL
jgi:hypothetical protein